MPKRIQRKRTKGWKMPKGAVYVGRPTVWGNPFVVGEFYGWYDPDTSEVVGPFRPVKDRREAVSFYREWIRDKHDLIESAKKVLRGKDLVCWCPLDQPCHADILLELANK